MSAFATAATLSQQHSVLLLATASTGPPSQHLLRRWLAPCAPSRPVSRLPACSPCAVACEHQRIHARRSAPCCHAGTLQGPGSAWLAVACTTGAGALLPGERLNISVIGVPTAAVGTLCASTARSVTVTARIGPVPVITLAPPRPTPPTCVGDGAASVTFNYSIVGLGSTPLLQFHARSDRSSNCSITPQGEVGAAAAARACMHVCAHVDLNPCCCLNRHTRRLRSTDSPNWQRDGRVRRRVCWRRDGSHHLPWAERQRWRWRLQRHHCGCQRHNSAGMLPEPEQRGIRARVGGS